MPPNTRVILWPTHLQEGDEGTKIQSIFQGVGH